MNTYEIVNMIISVEEASTMNAMFRDSGIEGCTEKTFGRPCWPEGTVLTYNPDGTVNMAASPAPTEYLSAGWLHVDMIDLLPENLFVPEVIA